MRTVLVRLSLLIVLVTQGLAAAPAPAAAAAGVEWVPPLSGPLTVAEPFAPPAERYGQGHRGVDLAGSAGMPVRAAGDGLVTYAGLLAGRGVVTVTHGALRTTYEPVTASVAPGETVLAGDDIGRLDGGHARCAPATCLHWGLRRGEDYLDPLRLLRRGPSRLLPWWQSAAGPASVSSVPGPATARPAPADAVPPETARPDQAMGPGAEAAPGWRLSAASTPQFSAVLLALLAGLMLLPLLRGLASGSRRRSRQFPHIINPPTRGH